MAHPASTATITPGHTPPDSSTPCLLIYTLLAMLPIPAVWVGPT
jgi:hypothetical protein